MTYLFGATSMLGWTVARRYAGDRLLPFCNPYTRLPACHAWRRLKLEDEAALESLFAAESPKVLLHCGGVCDVDKCEEDPEWAFEINVRGVERLLKHLPPTTRLVYSSSDHVFPGKDSGSYDEEAPVQPLTVYGQTRVEAERRIRSERPDSLVVRWALAIGESADRRSGHLDWLQHRTRSGLATTVVEDEFRSAVWAEDLADRVWQLAHSDITGLRHVVAERCVSRPELANSLNEAYGIGADLRVERRANRVVPHPGRIELATRYEDELAGPLASPAARGAASSR